MLSFLGEEKTVGIDIDQGSVRVASAYLNQDNNLVVENMGCSEYAPGASNKEIASTIKELWKKQHIKTHTVSSCLRSSLLILKQFRYSNLAYQEVESALLLEAEQLFQKDPEELYIDWHLYPSFDYAVKKEPQQQVEGVLTAALAKDVHRHLSILEIADLFPIVVDVGCMAISNLFLSLNGRVGSENLCLVNVGSHSLDIAIVSGDSYIYPSSIYSQSVTWLEKLDYLANYIVDVLRYHQFKLNKQPVKKVIFTGILSTDTRLKAKVKHDIQVPTEFWNPLESANLEKNCSVKNVAQGPAMAACLGLALRRE
jgi:Tfp pilus assembly PilM family ATPase